MVVVVVVVVMVVEVVEVATAVVGGGGKKESGADQEHGLHTVDGAQILVRGGAVGNVYLRREAAVIDRGGAQHKGVRLLQPQLGREPRELLEHALLVHPRLTCVCACVCMCVCVFVCVRVCVGVL